MTKKVCAIRDSNPGHSLFQEEMGSENSNH